MTSPAAVRHPARLTSTSLRNDQPALEALGRPGTCGLQCRVGVALQARSTLAITCSRPHRNSEKKRVRRSWGKITITRLKMYLVWCRQAFKNRHYRASRRRKEVGVFMLVSRGSESFLADEFVWHDPGRLLATLSFVETSHEGSPPRSGHPR
jgi:hypothetical protein